MKKLYLLVVLFALISLTTVGQSKEINIVPIPKHPAPLFIMDGIILGPKLSKEILSKENREIIDSISIRNDSVFDCNGQLVNIGIVRIFTKDSVNVGAKKILALTDNWLFNHPMTELEINNKKVDWGDDIYYKLISLKAGNILSAKVIRTKRDSCNSLLKLKILK